MPDKTKSVSSKAAEAPGDQAARVRDMCYQIPAKGGYPLVAVPAAPSERGDAVNELKEFGAWFDKEFRTDLTVTKSERRMARYGWEERARRGVSSQEGK